MALTYALINSATVSGNTATVTFDNIPQTYSDLIIKVSARSSTTNRNFGFTFNGNTNLIYSDWMIYAPSNSVSVTSRSSRSSTDYNYQNVNTDPNNSFSNIEFYIPHYTNTVSNKTAISDSAVGTTAAAGLLGHTAQSMASTTAITRIDFSASGDFTTGTKFWLYGILRA